jgi:hypothetical protein
MIEYSIVNSALQADQGWDIFQRVTVHRFRVQRFGLRTKKALKT